MWRLALCVLCSALLTVHARSVSDSLVLSTAPTKGMLNDDARMSTLNDEPGTTEEPLAPLKVTEMDVRSEIGLRYAYTTVVARVRNPARRAQESTFRVLLPDTAFISGFVMTIDGKSYKAYVKEKDEAKQIYNQAVSQGIAAAHVAAKARDSNHFTVSVNVEAGSSAVFNLTYEELLMRRNGVYNHAINLHPGTTVPKLTVTVHIKESQKISVLRVPEIRTGNEIDATENDAQNSKVVIDRPTDKRQATITFSPDIEEQKRLTAIFAQKAAASKSHQSSYMITGYLQEVDNFDDPEGTLGQFVVQYDVERPKGGEILVNDGYFVHFIAPSQLEALNKHVVFVLDTSSSMLGRKMEQLRLAMLTILDELNPGDYFNIVEFATSVQVHDLREADSELQPSSTDGYAFSRDPPLPAPVPASLATPDNVQRAKTITNRLQANGGTYIGGALDVAINLIRSKKNDTTNETNRLQSMIVFLTDGDPTVGNTDTKLIANRFTELNSGEDRAAVFSLAFGEDADRKFLRKLSLRNEGFMRHIYEAADAALQLRDFYRQVASPLMARVRFVYPPEQVKSDSVTKSKFHMVFAGSEVVVAGQVVDGVDELTPEVQAFCMRDPPTEVFDSHPRVRVRRGGPLPLERLWAYITIKQLLDRRDADDDAGPAAAALNISLKYGFVTPLTSLVVVRPNDTAHVDAEAADEDAIDSIYYGPVSSGYRVPGVANSFAGYRLSAQPMKLQGFSYSRDIFTSNQGPAGSYGIHGYNSFGGVDETAISRPGQPGPPGLPGPLGPPVRPGLLDPPDVNPSNMIMATTTPSQQLDSVPELADFPWARGIARRGELLIPAANATITLKLAGESAVPQEAGGDASCASAVGPAGGTGACVYLTRCAGARNITLAEYTAKHCRVNNVYAGVCCSVDRIDAHAP